MTALTLTARHALRRAGWPGMLGFVLLLGSPAVYLALVMPLQEQADALKAAQQQLRQEIAQHRGQQAPATPNTEMQLQAFYRQFPALSQSDAWLEKIYAAAAQQQIVLESAAYRLLPAEDGALQRYQMTLPLKGSHIQIRRFLSVILNEAPAIALDDIVFKRETIDTPTVSAVIKLTLFVNNKI
jgi:Tfp pilus assembly protein PilO